MLTAKMKSLKDKINEQAEVPAPKVEVKAKPETKKKVKK